MSTRQRSVLEHRQSSTPENLKLSQSVASSTVSVVLLGHMQVCPQDSVEFSRGSHARLASNLLAAQDEVIERFARLVQVVIHEDLVPEPLNLGALHLGPRIPNPHLNLLLCLSPSSPKPLLELLDRRRREEDEPRRKVVRDLLNGCLLYTSDAADEEDSVDLGGRRIIKKKKK
eukprot:TRINITY_DN289_c0_g1_i6.p1 TRINITY_DN289_c0_g1~~TRINITY_DN289_c0_g1_i6.p1  ORF type:complete len:173 (-),score=23.16 TRINITY_DN289_c0_g1_i6:127-645(-)